MTKILDWIYYIVNILTITNNNLLYTFSFHFQNKNTDNFYVICICMVF